MRLSKQDQERFWVHVDKRGPDDCWEWQQSRNPKGYGGFYVNNDREQAHRVAWTSMNGPIPEGMWVCHHCDNPPCCNPKHLFLGTNTDNVRDKIAKDRQSKGEQTRQAKLTEDDVRQIRKLYAAGDHTYAQLGRRFDVSHPTIRNIIERKYWKHVSERK